MPEFGFSRIKSGKIEPLEDNTYDIGKNTLRWRDIYLSGKAYASEFVGTVDYSNIRLPSGVWTNLNADELDGYHASDFAPASHTHSRSDITDFFASPFWTYIPDKPFSTLGSEFTVSSGELQVASIDFSKVTNRVSSLITFDSSLVPNADGSYDLGNSSYHWRRLYLGGQLADGTAISVDSNGRCNVIKMSVAGVDKGVICVYNVDGGDIQFRVNADVTNTLFDPNYPSWTIRVSGKFDAVDFLRKTSTTGYVYVLRVTSGDIMSYRTVRPASDNAYDLGNESYRWRNGYFAGFLDVGSLRIGGTEVITSGRVLQNVTADASIITSGTLAWERIAENFPRYAEEVINDVSLQGWMVFDGENDYALIDPFSVNSQSVTVIVMINTKSVPQVGWDRKVPIRLNFPSFAITIRLVPSTGNIEVGTAGPGYDIRYVETAVLNEWQVWAIRITDGNTLSVFKNGSKVFTYSKTYPDEDSELLSLGGVYQFVASTAYNGGIAYVFVYSPALSDEEIQQICKDPTNPPTDGLVLWLDGSSIDYANRIWRDKSGNGNDAVIYGAVPGGFPPKFHTHSSADVVYNSSMIPSSDNAFDIGDGSHYWRNIYWKGTLYGGSGAKIDFAEETGDKILLWGNTFGIGIEFATLKMWVRDPGSSHYFKWYRRTDDGTETLVMYLNTYYGLLPGQDDAYNLGSDGMKWHNIYYKGTLYGGSAEFSGKLQTGLPVGFGEAGVGSKVIIKSTDACCGQLQIGNPGDNEASIGFVPQVTGFGCPPSSDAGYVFVAGVGVWGIGADHWGIGEKLVTASWVWKVSHVGTVVQKGDLLPASDNAVDIGNESLRWRNISYGGVLRVYVPGSATKQVIAFNEAGNDIFSVRYNGAGFSPNNALEIVDEYGGYGTIFSIKQTGEASLKGSFLPMSDNASDLGNSTYRWKDGYFAGTVYASQFIGNIDWSYVVNKPNLVIGNGTKYVFVGSTEPTATQVGDIWIETY